MVTPVVGDRQCYHIVLISVDRNECGQETWVTIDCPLTHDHVQQVVSYCVTQASHIMTATLSCDNEWSVSIDGFISMLLPL